MIEILPIKLLTPEDSLIFGGLAVNLGKLARLNFPVSSGIVVCAPEFKLKTALEHFDFGSKEIFEQSLTLVKKEIHSIPVPENLRSETKKAKHFLLNREIIKSSKDLWQKLLHVWIEEIKSRLWRDGFYPNITQGLQPQIVIFIKKVESMGTAFFDNLQDDTVINIRMGKLHPNDLKKIHELVSDANKKLFIPHEYEWIIDLPARPAGGPAGRQGGGLKLTGINQYTPPVVSESVTNLQIITKDADKKSQSAVKVFLDLSDGFTIEKEIDPDSIWVDGVYISSEKIFDLNKPSDSFENLVFKIVESAITFSNSPVFVKLADKSEGMGKVRGTLRLLHQKSLFDPLVEALDFARHKKGLTNVHIVIPFVRGVNELLQIKRELAVKKLSRKNSLELWMEVCTPENIINLEEYLLAGIDGVVLNLDELISFLNGFDITSDEMAFYKKEITALLKFLEDSIKLLHKSKVKFIATGSLILYPQVLEFLVEKGIDGVVIEKYEAYSIRDLLYQTEKRVLQIRL